MINPNQYYDSKLQANHAVWPPQSFSELNGAVEARVGLTTRRSTDRNHLEYWVIDFLSLFVLPVRLVCSTFAWREWILVRRG